MDVLPVYNLLRPYQKEAYEALITRPRMLNFDDMGLGKTLTTLVALEYRRTSNKQKVLIVCPTYSLFVWQVELAKWFQRTSVVYYGTVAARAKIWKNFLQSDIPYIICTYRMSVELLAKQTNFMWYGIVADEIHTSGLLNSASATYTSFEKSARDIPVTNLLTGTPIRQGCLDLFAPLHIMDRTKFPNKYQFIHRWCNTIETPFGKEIDRNPRDKVAFREMLVPYLIRRMKDEVLDELPGKQRQAVFVEMTPKQRKIYHELAENLVAVHDDGNAILVPSQMTAIIRLRQLLTCPRLLGVDDDGAALTTLHEMAADLIENNKPILVFTPFHDATMMIADIMSDCVEKKNTYILKGGMSPLEFGNTWQAFQNNPTKKKLLICVIKSGASFQATEAANVFFLGYEWDFNMNVQAEDRSCRMGQRDFVNIYYLMHKGTIDVDILSALDSKLESSIWSVGTDQQLAKLMKRYTSQCATSL